MTAPLTPDAIADAALRRLARRVLASPAATSDLLLLLADAASDDIEDLRQRDLLADGDLVLAKSLAALADLLRQEAPSFADRPLLPELPAVRR